MLVYSEWLNEDRGLIEETEGNAQIATISKEALILGFISSMAQVNLEVMVGKVVLADKRIDGQRGRRQTRSRKR